MVTGFSAAAKQTMHDVYFQNALWKCAPEDPFGLEVPTPTSIRENYIHIRRHAKNLMRACFDTKRLCAPDETLPMATYLALILKNDPSGEVRFIPKAVSSLSRDLFFDGKTRRVAVIAEFDTASLKAKGTYKTVRAAMLVFLQRPHAKPKFCVFTFSSCLGDTFGHKKMIEEIGRFTLFPNVRGIANLEMHQITDYSLMALFEGYSSGPIGLIPDSITHLQMLQIALDLLYGLKALHAKGITHADIKNTNAVFRILPDTTAQGALIDLDQSFSPLHGGETNWSYSCGYHPSFWATAPELFGVERATHFTAEDYFKMDIFALGYDLHQLFSSGNHIAPWSKIIQNSYKLNFDRVKEMHKNQRKLRQDQQNVDELITQYIEDAFMALQDAPDTVDKAFSLTILGMMRLRPSDRISLDVAIRAFELLIHHEMTPALVTGMKALSVSTKDVKSDL